MAKLTRSQQRFVRRRVERPAEEPDPLKGELNIIPFLDIVVNLILFILVSMTTVLAVAQVDAQLPELGRGRGGGTPSLHLTVTLADRGMIVAGAGGTVAPGCEGLAAGSITVPKRGDVYDFEGLTACLQRVKRDFPGEREVIVSANPNVPYEAVVATMDAARTDGVNQLFPAVLISAGVR